VWLEVVGSLLRDWHPLAVFDEALDLRATRRIQPNPVLPIGIALGSGALEATEFGILGEVRDHVGHGTAEFFAALTGPQPREFDIGFRDFERLWSPYEARSARACATSLRLLSGRRLAHRRWNRELAHE
jgi:hypothetical protein